MNGSSNISQTAKEVIDSIGSDKILEPFRFVIIMSCNVGDLSARNRLDRTLLSVKKKRVEANTNPVVIYVSHIRGLPVKSEILDSWDFSLTIQFGNQFIGQLWDGVVQNPINGFFNAFAHGSLKEKGEKASAVRNEISVEVNVHFTTIDVTLDVSGLDSRHNMFVMSGLRFKNSAHSDINLIQINLSMPSGSDEWCSMITESFAFENSGQFFILEDQFVVLLVKFKGHILFVLLEMDGVALQIVAVLVLEIRHLDLVQALDDLVPIGILGIVDHTFLDRSLETLGHVLCASDQ